MDSWIVGWMDDIFVEYALCKSNLNAINHVSLSKCELTVRSPPR